MALVFVSVIATLGEAVNDQVFEVFLFQVSFTFVNMEFDLYIINWRWPETPSTIYLLFTFPVLLTMAHAIPSVHKSLLFLCHNARPYSLFNIIQYCDLGRFTGPTQNYVIFPHYRIYSNCMPIQFFPFYCEHFGGCVLFILVYIFQAVAQTL